MNTTVHAAVETETDTFLLLAGVWAVSSQSSGSSVCPVIETGQTSCYDDEVEISCPSPGQAWFGQDA